MGLAWQKLPGRSTGLGTHRTAYDARGGMGGALGVLGVGYAGRSQRRMRRVNRSAARLSRGGIGDLRVECVKEVSGRVSFSIWGAGAPWERPPTDYLKGSPPPRGHSGIFKVFIQKLHKAYSSKIFILIQNLRAHTTRHTS